MACKRVLWKEPLEGRMGGGSVSTIAATVPLGGELQEERKEKGVWHRWLKERNRESLGSGQLALVPFHANRVQPQGDK